MKSPRNEIKEDSMNEVFTLAAGLTLGILFSAGTGRLQSWRVRSVLILLAGIAAVFVSGEYRESWGFVLLDIGLLMLPVGLCLMLARHLCRLAGAGSIRDAFDRLNG